MPKEIPRRDISKQIRESARSVPYNRDTILRQYRARAERMVYLRQWNAHKAHVREGHLQQSLERHENTLVDYKIRNFPNDLFFGRQSIYHSVSITAGKHEVGHPVGNQWRELRDNLKVMRDFKKRTTQARIPSTEEVRLACRKVEKLVKALSSLSDTYGSKTLIRLPNEFKRLND